MQAIISLNHRAANACSCFGPKVTIYEKKNEYFHCLKTFKLTGILIDIAWI
jgi:hypothetical protein